MDKVGIDEFYQALMGNDSFTKNSIWIVEERSQIENSCLQCHI